MEILRAIGSLLILVFIQFVRPSRWESNLGWCRAWHSKLFEGDFNGDGTTDLLCHRPSDGYLWMAFANDKGQFDGISWERALGNCRRGLEIHIGDFNGDGRSDMFCHDKSTGYIQVELAHSKGDLLPEASWQRSHKWCYHSGSELHIGDYNGDGRDDMLCHQANNGSTWIAYASKYGSFDSPSWEKKLELCSLPSNRVFIGDFNGDSKDDLLCSSNDGWTSVIYANSAGNFDPSTGWGKYINGCYTPGTELYIGDFNGDGRDDLLCHGYSTGLTRVALATFDDKFSKLTKWKGSSGWCNNNSAEIHVGDFNGDGNTDMLCHDTTSGNQGITYADFTIFGELIGLLFSRNTRAEDETYHLFEELLKNYDKRIRPFFGTGQPVEVTVSIGIVSFESVSDVNLDFTLNTYLVQSWVDPRLRYNSSIRLPPTSHFVDNLWIPDLIFLNAKKAELHTVTTKNRVVEIFSDGTVYLVQRLKITIACAMDFRHFPMDQQRCPVDLESFEYTGEDLIFRFHRSELPPVFAFADSSKVPQFKVKGASLQSCSKPSAIGIISCIRLELFFKRRVEYYYLHAYVPCFMLVALSWLSFWIDVRRAPARVALGITTTLIMLATSNGVRQDLPRFAYVKSIDIWFAANFTFVISVLLEYSLVHYIAAQRPRFKYLQNAETEREESNEDSQSVKAAENEITCIDISPSDFNDCDESTSGQHVSDNEEEPEYLSKREITSVSENETFKYGWGQKIDALSRIIFPVMYFSFLIVYFWFSYEEYEIPEFSMDDLEKAFFNDTVKLDLSK